MQNILSKSFYIIVSVLLSASTYIINSNSLNLFIKKFSEAVFWITIPILIFAIIVSVLKKEIVFRSWSRFTNYFFILALVILILTPTSTHGLDFVPFVKETVSMLLAGVYSIISLILIVYKSLKKE